MLRHCARNDFSVFLYLFVRVLIALNFVKCMSRLWKDDGTDASYRIVVCDLVDVVL